MRRDGRRGHGRVRRRGSGAHAHGQAIAGGQHGQAGRGEDQHLRQLVAATLAGDAHGAFGLLLAAQRLAQHSLDLAVEQPVAGAGDEQAGDGGGPAPGEEPRGDGGGQRGQRAFPPELLGQPRVDLAQGTEHAGAHTLRILGRDDIDVRVVRVAAEDRLDHVRIQFRGGHVAQRREQTLHVGREQAVVGAAGQRVAERLEVAAQQLFHDVVQGQPAQVGAVRHQVVLFGVARCVQAHDAQLAAIQGVDFLRLVFIVNAHFCQGQAAGNGRQ